MWIKRVGGKPDSPVQKTGSCKTFATECHAADWLSASANISRVRTCILQDLLRRRVRSAPIVPGHSALVAVQRPLCQIWYERTFNSRRPNWWNVTKIHWCLCIFAACIPADLRLQNTVEWHILNIYWNFCAVGWNTRFSRDHFSLKLHFTTQCSQNRETKTPSSPLFL